MIDLLYSQQYPDSMVKTLYVAENLMESDFRETLLSLMTIFAWNLCQKKYLQVIVYGGNLLSSHIVGYLVETQVKSEGKAV